MPFTVQQLIEGRPKPITVSPQDTIQRALALMTEHDFSQLPVVDEKEKPLGMVTGDSILQALMNFGVSLAELRVSHAILKVDTYSPDEDLFDLLDDLKNTYGVLIIDAEGTLIGIVTSYDTTEYFRRRAEDMMYVEDIETTLKDFIRVAFHVSDETDQQKLAAVIAEMEDADARKKFQKALQHYINRLGRNGVGFDKAVAEEVFAKHFASNGKVQSLDELTLHDYIQLLLHDSIWPQFSSVFQLQAGAVHTLLDGVRKTRNALAHFHGEISPAQRDQLHFCIAWLERQRQAVLDAFQMSAEITAPQQEEVFLPSTGVDGTEAEEEIVPVEEPLRPDESRYAPLALWLQQQSLRQEKLTLTFTQIEEIIGEALPTSARQHRSWWANDSVGHVQSRQWLDVGWRVANIAMTEEKVTFARIKDRERGYISFYSGILKELREIAPPFLLREAGPDGLSWMIITKLPTRGPQAGFLGYAFARQGRFRVEFYIDAYNQEKNKRLFDLLYLRKEEIQAELRGIQGSLEWERIDGKRASRVALYHPGAITDPPEELAQLHSWAIEAVIRFHKVIDQQASEILNMA
jgi:CBS domain-containing protein